MKETRETLANGIQAELHEAGYPDSAIMEILGWSSMAMLWRYLGKIPLAQLKRYPTTLERVFGRAE